MNDLHAINDFGAIDAESDDLLAKCFESHPAYLEALDGRRFLVLGRKGAGKTAIYKKIILLRDHSTFSVGHSFADYPWHYHDAQVVHSAAEQERYLHSWKYLILLSLSKILLNFDQSQPWSDGAMEALAKIEGFIVDTYGSKDPDITEVFHPGKRLRHLSKLKVDLKVFQFGKEEDGLAMEHLPRVFQDVNRSLEALVLTSLNPANRYYVCFDQLDIGFQPTSAEYHLRLIGLILAARDFANAARERGCALKVLVFLRSDIYHRSLLFEDKNKITDTYRVELEWDQPGTATLKSVMERRFGEVLGIPPGNSWDVVFDETTEMRGHQTKYQHILDRTFRRPRDVIKFCNCVLDVFHRRQGEKFSNEDVNLAHTDYSNYLRAEIVDEIHKYYPDQKIYFEMLRQLGYQVFTQDDFAKAYAAWKEKLQQPRPMDEILEQLYDFSIIGAYRAGGRGYGGAEYMYKYVDPRAEFNRVAERFRVHWGLVEALDLKQYKVA